MWNAFPENFGWYYLFLTFTSWNFPLIYILPSLYILKISILYLDWVITHTHTHKCWYFVAENEAAFDVLYCVAFKLMDTLWLAMHASYMEFNASLFYLDSFCFSFLLWILPLNHEIYSLDAMAPYTPWKETLYVSLEVSVYDMMLVTWADRGSLLHLWVNRTSNDIYDVMIAKGR